MLQSALDVALSVVRANPSVLEGLGAHLEGDFFAAMVLSYCFLHSVVYMILCYNAPVSLWWPQIGTNMHDTNFNLGTFLAKRSWRWLIFGKYCFSFDKQSLVIE